MNITNQNFVPHLYRSSFKKLVPKIVAIEEVSILECLTGGFSESVPLLVYAKYKDSQGEQIIKIGEKKIIREEADNWEKFIKNGPYGHENVIHLKQRIESSPHSLIVYNLAGRDPITFKKIYERQINPEVVLENLFYHVLKPNSDRILKKHCECQIKDIIGMDAHTIKEITKQCRRLSGSKMFDKMPEFQFNDIIVDNPLCFYPFNNYKEPAAKAISLPIGIIHGDLHAGNILLYKSNIFVEEGAKYETQEAGIPCIIDFAWTGMRCLFIDIARMEGNLKFSLLDIERIGIENAILFEKENILSGMILPKNPVITNTDLQKIFQCIKVLREIAQDIIKKGGYSELGYWLELYKNSLLHIKYEISDLQKRFALISSAIILTSHLNNVLGKET